MSAALRVWTCWSVIALQLASVWAATGNCKAGGAGYALAFDGLDGTTFSMKWDNPPTMTITIEYWANIFDPHLTQQPVFAYSAYNVAGRDGAGGDPYEVHATPNEVRHPH